MNDMKYKICIISLLLSSVFFLFLGVKEMLVQCYLNHICTVHLRYYYVELQMFFPKSSVSPLNETNFQLFMKDFIDPKYTSCPSIPWQDHQYSYQIHTQTPQRMYQKIKKPIVWESPCVKIPLTDIDFEYIEKRHFGQFHVLWNDGSVTDEKEVPVFDNEKK